MDSHNKYYTKLEFHKIACTIILIINLIQKKPDKTAKIVSPKSIHNLTRRRDATKSEKNIVKNKISPIKYQKTPLKDEKKNILQIKTLIHWIQLILTSRN